MEENKINEELNKIEKKSKSLSRRSAVKGLATIPLLGIFGYEFILDRISKSNQEKVLLKELGFSSEAPAVKSKEILSGKKETIHLGMIGTGPRGMQLLDSLGYRTKEDLDKTKKSNLNNLNSWLKRDDLNIKLTGICDVFDLHAEMAVEASKNSRSAYANSIQLPGTKRYRNYKELINSSDIDAVIIATPDHQHAQMTIDAVKAGKHVYLEKCLSRTLDEAFEIEAAVKESDSVFQLGHQLRNNPIFQRARNLISQNILGPVSLIETTTNRNSATGAWIRHLNTDGTLKTGSMKTIDWDQWLGNAPKVPFSLDRFYGWTKWFDYGNGPWGQLFSHEYDAVNGLLDLGVPKYCNASGSINYWKENRETPDTFNAVWEYPERNLTMLYSLSLANSQKRGRLIMGRDATMDIGASYTITADANSKRYSKYLSSGVINSSEPFHYDGPDKGNIDGITSASAKYYAERGLTKTTIDGEQIDLTYLHIKDWLNVIRNGGKTSCGIDESVNEMITILMATKSYLLKRRVEWDPTERRII